MIYKVVLVSGVQQSNLVTHTHVSIRFQILFPSRSLQSIEDSSLYYTIGPCWLSILYIVVCVCVCSSQALDLCLPIYLFPLVILNFVSDLYFGSPLKKNYLFPFWLCWIFVVVQAFFYLLFPKIYFPLFLLIIRTSFPKLTWANSHRAST